MATALKVACCTIGLALFAAQPSFAGTLKTKDGLCLTPNPTRPFQYLGTFYDCRTGYPRKNYVRSYADCPCQPIVRRVRSKIERECPCWRRPGSLSGRR